MTDITNVFKAMVKSVRVRQKNTGAVTGPDKNYLLLITCTTYMVWKIANQPNLGQCQILEMHSETAVTSTEKVVRLPGTLYARCRVVETDCRSAAREPVSSIGKLRDFLLKNRRDYLNTMSHLGCEESKMTDRQRDQIDADAEIYIKTCVSAIKQLRTQAHGNKVMLQVKEHKEIVLDLIDQYLTGVCQLYSEQRAIRVKHVIDRKRIGRLEPVYSSDRAVNHSSGDTNSSQLLTTLRADASTDRLTSSTAPAHQDGGAAATISTGTSRPPVTVDDVSVYPDNVNTSLLSDEDRLMLQMENEQLYDELNSIVDEVRQIEGKIVEISRLQEVFADKVVQQELDISKVSDTVMGTTENIKDGNDEIREAMKNNAGFRIWILFFLIVCTVSLLFLDWYNP